MVCIRQCAVGLLALTAVWSSSVAASEVSDIEVARANARAGGPTNAYDAYLLERYGRLSGSRDGHRGDASQWQTGDGKRLEFQRPRRHE